MAIRSYQASAFVPTGNRSGNQSATIFRAKNMFLRSRGENLYLECAANSLNLNEPAILGDLTGFLTFSPASRIITGTGTAFLSELHPFHRILVRDVWEIIIIEEVISNTSFRAVSFPLTTGTGDAGARMPILFEMDKKRGVLLSGRAEETDKGHILCVGSGELRVNGAFLPGTSLIASKKAQIAFFNPATGNYRVSLLGFPTEPVGVIVTASAAVAPKTFNDGNVNTGTDQVTITAHGFQTGQKVSLTNSGGALPVTSPAGLLIAKHVYIIRIDANTVQFATSFANSYAGMAINITTAAGGGTHTVTPVTKAMDAGDRSLLIAKANSEMNPFAYGNPSEKIKVTLTAGQQIKIDFPAMDIAADPSSLHNAWRIYGSLFGGTTANATVNANNGAWYLVRTFTFEELGTTGAVTVYLEYLDAEIFGTLRIVSFDNDAPVDAESIATVAGYPVLVSCQGKGTTASLGGTSPGPSIVPFKVSNRAAAPLALGNGQRAEVPLSPPESIIGHYVAAGRLYLMTANTLQIAVFTADQDFPIATRPFWKSGFKNPYALCFVNGRLYGFTSAGMVRSIAEGEEGSEEHAFAADVEELTTLWRPENVFVVHDPKNEAVCFINSAAFKNAFGGWVSEILPFMLREDRFGPLHVIDSGDETDRIVCGAATVNGHLEFLAGGSIGGLGNPPAIETYRFDEGTGSIKWSVGWQFRDDGVEDRPKRIKNFSVRGKTTAATFGIHGAGPDEIIDVAAMEAGNTSSKTGALAIPDSAQVRISKAIPGVVNGLMQYSPNITGTWNGSGIRDRVDEVTVDVIVQGARK